MYTNDSLADTKLVDISRVDEVAASLDKPVQQGVRECLVTLAWTRTLSLPVERFSKCVCVCVCVCAGKKLLRLQVKV